MSADATVFFAREANDHYASTYGPEWEKLLLREGVDESYPMPPAHAVIDLLPALHNVKGIAVRTVPETTVTEGQGYAMLVAGMQRDIATLKGLTVGWQAQGQAFAGQQACGGCCADGETQHDPPKETCAKPTTAGLCRQVRGAYMPGWKWPVVDAGSMGSATDADEDAITGIIMLAELLNDDGVREYAVKSIAAFVLEDLGLADAARNSRPVPLKGDIPDQLQTIWLWRGGTCWGGWEASASGQGAENRNLCIAPAYFSPGQWRLFAKYLEQHSQYIPSEIGFGLADLVDVLMSAITWGYNTLQRISCTNGLVSNWWTLPANNAWPWETQDGLVCHNSATRAGNYGPDAVRIPWRVVLDYVWFADESKATALYDEQGKHVGTFGAKEYANRWASSWRAAISSATDYDGSVFKVGSYPPLREDVLKLRPDQILPLLQKLEPCSTCPNGMTASPWNGWGGQPIITTFQVPLDGVLPEEQQQWMDFMADIAFQGCTHGPYFDAGSQVVVSSMLGGKAWLAVKVVAPAPPPPALPPISPPMSPNTPPAAQVASPSAMRTISLAPVASPFQLLQDTPTSPPSLPHQTTSANADVRKLPEASQMIVIISLLLALAMALAVLAFSKSAWVRRILGSPPAAHPRYPNSTAGGMRNSQAEPRRKRLKKVPASLADAAMSIGEMKSLLHERGVDFRDCVEKQDLIERLASTA